MDTFINGKHCHMYLIVMRNVFWSHQPVQTYDLKGSTYKRTSMRDGKMRSTVYKDLDWVSAGLMINLGHERATSFFGVIQRDVEFLKSQNTMDYSLIIGIMPISPPAEARGFNPFTDPVPVPPGANPRFALPLLPQSNRPPEGPTAIPMPDLNSINHLPVDDDFSKPILSACGQYLYTAAIIDTLTEYTFRKKAEYVIKRVINGDGASCKPPTQYADRFLTFIGTYLQ